jgi:nitroreductase
VADTAKLGGDDAARLATANADTGFIAQNVYLFCASEGLGTVVRGSVNRADLGKALNLRADAADHPGANRGLRQEVRRQLIYRTGVSL